MGRSKKFRTIYSENGIEYFFNTDAFKDAIDKECDKRETSKGAVYRSVCEQLYPGANTSSKIETVKKWYYGCNSPSPEDVIELERILNCTLTKPRQSPDIAEIERNDSGMNANITQTTTHANNPPFSQDVITAAKQAYGILADLIHLHHRLMISFIHNVNDRQHPCVSLVFGQISGDCIPANYPLFTEMVCQIHKLRFDLPCQVCTAAIALGLNIYGYRNAEVDSFATEGCMNMDYDIEDFNMYAYNTPNPQSSELLDDCELYFTWLEFAAEQAKDYYDEVDEIFQANLR